MNEEDQEILAEFLVESVEIIDQLDREFVELEKEPDSRSRLASIFRAAHTIKGTSGLLGFHKLESVTHAGENVLAKLRDGKLTLSPDMTSALLHVVDAVREMLSAIEQTGEEGDGCYDELVADLNAFLKPAAPKVPVQEPAPETAAAEPPAEAAEPPGEAAEPPGEAPGEAAKPPGEAAKSPGEAAESLGETGNAPAATPAGDVPNTSAVAVAPPEEPTEPPATDESTPEAAAANPPATTAAATTDEKPAAQVKESAASQPTGSAQSKNSKASSNGPVAAEASVRIGVGILDRLMNLVGELVLARNQILQSAVLAEDQSLTSASQRLNLITSELQEGIMQTRMQPISSVWSKFPRIVRDLAMACGKQVKLELEGRQTELDRTIIEAIRDPLTHIVRNSVDHGIESSEDRVRAGKSPEGTLGFRAFHESGMVNIEVTDDGKGIDPEAVRAKAVERSVLSHEAAAKLSDRDAVLLVFQPGFSTAQKVSNVSGRGVGMDVVKTSIEKIGGTVDIQSQKGQGTTIRVKIPLTLAIIPALLVTCRKRRYAIPQVSLLEMVRLNPEDKASSIEYVRDTPVYRLRGTLLPLLFLEEILGDTAKGEPNSARATFTEKSDSGSAASEGDSNAPLQADQEEPVELNIVVLHADGKQFGLVVDSVEDTQEIVVKPLGRELKGIAAFAGATIMGDGRVALILDVFGIANQMGMSASAVEALRLSDETHEDDPSQPLLVVESVTNQSFALALDCVNRLEEIAVDRIESTGQRKVLQYRGNLLPLVFIEEICEGQQPAEFDAPLQVIVVSHAGQEFGVIVSRIVDIVDHHGSLHTNVQRPGITGCAVVDGRVTELVDLSAGTALVNVRTPATEAA